ncbi:pyrimidine reductase family protein [Yinghuangia soli]|uniref:Pyrimidine reductase family protein n=1 Tax=Yinghuangia soli TaxID=2908204 RepID=A0AA41U0B0_9ACTN|nr:pyrimidine reductase family protein [Yinghuangia soli]MCF2526247.1 pyrimidine reductase family protein [Yinghuangia soli]
MRRLFPADPAPVAESPAEIDLDILYAYPAEVIEAGRPWLRANMVASLDGAAQAGDGLSAGLSSPADKRIFGVLRALADVVLVGASTVRKEGYRPAKVRPAYAPARIAAGRPPAPVIAIVTRSLDLDFSAPLFTDAAVPTIVLTGPDCDPDRLAAARKAAEVIVAGPPGSTGVDPGAAVDALVERGWTRILTEGGPNLLGQLLAAGRLDELCLALGPLMAGGPATRITDAPAPAVPQRMELHTLLEDDGFLFARYVRNIDS